MRTRLAVIALALALAGTLLAAAPAVAAPPPGQTSSLPYLTGRTVHHGESSFTVPDQTEGGKYTARYQLLGLDSRGRWLVGVDLQLVDQPEPYTYHVGAHARLLAVTRAGTTVVYDELSNAGADPYFRLNRTRSTVLLAYHLSDDDSIWTTTFRVLDLDGRTRVLSRGNYAYELSPLDFNRNRIVLHGPGLATRLWTPGVRSRLLTRRKTVFADARFNALGVLSTRNRWAMTSLTRPAKVRWQARFVPVRIASNGKWVAGWSLTKKGKPRPVVQVRRMSDGRLRAAYPRAVGTPGDTLAWDTGPAVVFARDAGGAAGRVLVRCVLSGGCTRASAAFFAGFSFPFAAD